ncbi:WD40 repeat-like protein [Suillus brevipes Sb2]|nr:WD40 repeat-like protein [Suillus brevipes Sb2]
MDAPTKHNSLATMPLRKTKVDSLRAILCLPDKKRIIVNNGGSLQVWDLETGTQVGEEWEDKDFRVEPIALSPDGKKIASGSWNGAVKLWNVDTGKVIQTWKGQTDRVNSVSWSSDGERVVSGSSDGMFTVWDVESGKTILGPINTHLADDVLGVLGVCYSPDIDAKMIATGGNSYDRGLQIWNADSGELLKTFRGVFTCLAWTSDGKTLIAGGSKFDTATWTKVDMCQKYVNAISVSPNDRILATTPYLDVTPRPAPKIKGARIPPGFFDDALREANLRIRLSQSQSHAPPTPTHQRTFNPFTSVWRSSEPHGATESATQSRSRPFSWTRNFSGILRRRDRSDIQLREVEVPCTAGQPRNYHGGKGKKPVASSSRPSNPHTTQTHNAVIQSTSTSPPAANTSSLSAVTGTSGTMGAPSHPHTTAVWRARFSDSLTNVDPSWDVYTACVVVDARDLYERTPR